MNARTKNSNNFAGATTRLMRAGIAALFNKETLVTALLCVVAIMLTSSIVMAQTGGGTTIFGQDETMVPNAVRYAVIFLFGIAFLFGAGSVVWGVMAYTRRQECMNWIIGGALCMVVGGVVAGVAYLAGGNALDVNRDLSFLDHAVTTTLAMVV